MEKADKLLVDALRDHASRRGIADLLVKIFRNEAAKQGWRKSPNTLAESALCSRSHGTVIHGTAARLERE